MIFTLLLCILIFASSSTLAANECVAGNYRCVNNGKCIPNSWVCDRENDCGDNSDEQNCPTLPAISTTTPYFFPTNAASKSTDDLFTIIPELWPTIAERCNPIFYFECKSTANCIDLHFACNGKQDCQDNSDETDCSNCKPNQFRCKTSGRCVLGIDFCDNYKDCDDNSDEANCTAVKQVSTSTSNPGYCPSPDQFKCVTSGECINPLFVCDKWSDCLDYSDEADCSGCNAAYYVTCKSTNRCIPIKYRCDREKDCPDGSDEQNCN